ncbi:hypothetical protein DL96DRAFT_1596766 [Flagelloscypha sp. PMI_526]|nr:hypothetical protein DL96DRAFT_1596766 [Flagelloscypha sp. PMI_526]
MRRRVPAALRAELTEYTSLIRALRTNATRDIVPQLSLDFLEPPPSPSDLATPEPHSGYSEPPPSSQDTSFEPSSAPSRKRAKRNHKLTRWPQLPDDVFVPEWELEDEIAHLISQHLAHLRSSENAGDDGQDVLSGEDDEVLEQSLAPITEATTAYLSSILALIAAHTPARVQSMQNRVRPLDWKDVLKIVGSPLFTSGDEPRERTAKIVAERLSLAYGDGEPLIDDERRSLPRVSLESLKTLDLTLFSLPELRPRRSDSPKPAKRKKAKGGQPRSTKGRRKEKARDPGVQVDGVLVSDYQ